jgi:RNA-splicing ligase RtcB
MEKVRYFTNSEYPPDSRTTGVLEKMSEAEGVAPPVVALPDLHYKYSYYTPTGTVVLSRDRIFPKFVNANCGMSFVTTDLAEGRLSGQALDDIFNSLRERISVSTRLSPVISRADLEDIIARGAAWTYERHGMDMDDIANYENGGNVLAGEKFAPEELAEAIPAFSRDVALLSLGVLGYGNHFIEMQVVDEILDKETAALFGIREKQVCFMLHGDSRGFGQSLIDHHSRMTKKIFGLQQAYKRAHYGILASKAPMFVKRAVDGLNFYLNRAKSTVYWKMDAKNKKEADGFASLAASSPEGKAYLLSTYAAVNFGYANRAYMVSVIRDALNGCFGKASVRVLHDGNHDALQREELGGESFLAHRNGAARAYPRSFYKDHGIFSKTGQPVLLPSALARPSFLCAAGEGSRASYYSACHGTGRVVDRGEARERFSKEDMLEEVKKCSMRVYDYGRGKSQEESPRAFKDVNKILDTMKMSGIAKPVAKMRPVAALKGWR